MISISYDAENQAAIVAGDDILPAAIWADVRRVCVEGSQEIIQQRARSITVPWCSFVLLRPDLRYVLQKHSLTLSVSPEAKNLLLQAEQQRIAYQHPTSAHGLDAHTLQVRLAEVGFARPLTPEQARNVLNLLRFPACASFSVPGAGKTTEALAYFFLRRESNTRLVVVAPKNAFAAWEEQLHECSPDGRYTIVRLQGGESGVKACFMKNPTIGLITYQQLSNVVAVVAAYMSRQPCFMVLDESHRMKRGQAGVQGAAILRLAHLPEYKLILSGTPMPNNIADLIPQFTFLYPMIKVKDETVAEHIRSVYVRTTKSELGLRDPIRLRQLVPMAPAQRRLYESLRSEAARQLEHLTSWERNSLRSVGRSVMRLLQVTTEPALIAHTELSDQNLLMDAITEGPSPKVMEACRIARELAAQGHKSIIWSQFVQIVEVVADSLADLGAVYIHGGVEVDEDEENLESREAKIARFHDDPTCMVMVANPAACSEGISLHRVCHHALYLDRNYNAAQYLQSEDRIHRLGMALDQNTYVTVLHTPDSIDDSVQRRLETKIARMRDVLNDDGLNIEPLSFDDELGLDREDLLDIRRILVGDD